MSITIVEEKIKRLPESSLALLNDYVDILLERAQKVQALQGVFSKNANPDLIAEEKNAWKKKALEKHLHG